MVRRIVAGTGLSREPEETTHRGGRSAWMLAAMLLMSGIATAAEPAGYWSWGWGTYGGSSDLDVARWDWSLVNFGSVRADESAPERCRRILALNPEHRFMIRVWPLFGGSQKVPLMRFAFEPEARQRLLDETARQVHLIVDDPALAPQVVGLTFLEELPGHFTTCWMRDWKADDPPPEDLSRYRDRIEAAIGEPLTRDSQAFAKWWGERYAEALEAIHRTMKESSGGKPVFYWNHTGFYNLTTGGWEAGTPYPANLVPVTYDQILKPGVCDGIFGYPNRADIWEKQTLAVVRAFDCPFFSQTSMPGKMRLVKFPELLDLARVKDPRNLGTFIYPGSGKEEGFVWNRLPYLDGKTYWTPDDRLRHLGWELEMRRKLVDRHVQPELLVDYDFTGPGRTIHFLLRNMRDVHWFGGDAEAASIRYVSTSVRVGGQAIHEQKYQWDQLPAEAPATPLPPLGPGDVTSFFAVVPATASITDETAVEVMVGYRTHLGQELTVTVLANGPRHRLPSWAAHRLERSGDTWIEPGFALPEAGVKGAVELLPMGGPVVNPALSVAGQTVRFKETVLREHRLIVGPGRKAMLYRRSLWDETVRRFGRGEREAAVAAETGYQVFGTPAASVRPGGRYRLTLTGQARDGGNSLVLLMFSGERKGEARQHSESCLANQFGANSRTVEHVFTAPEFDPGTTRLRVLFYRFQSRGAVTYQAFDVQADDFPPAAGIDLTEQLEGELPPLGPPWSLWRYATDSDPGNPVDVRFLPAAEIEAIEAKTLGLDDDNLLNP